MSVLPEHFSIVDYGNNTLMPSKTVKAGVFKVVRRDDPIQMSIDGEVAFKGFGTCELFENEKRKEEDGDFTGTGIIDFFTK